VFFIGWKDGDRIPPMVETHAPDGDPLGARPYVTVGKALSGMPEPSDACTIPNHIGRDHSTRIVDRYRGLRFGERDPKTRINKLDPGRPSFTIIVGSDHGGGKGHVHPYSPREVTPRESARIQTFPDWWVFHGTGRHVIRQVGNAVPPLFAALLGQHIAKYVFGRSRLASYEALAHNLGLDFLL
jgi:DNA (cytosine-5)-methyltransferase 1